MNTVFHRGIQEWSTFWDVIHHLFYVGLESGHRVDVLPMFSFVLDSSVVNILRFMSPFYYFGFDRGQHVEIHVICSYRLGSSGQHVDILTVFSIALDSKVVTMLRLYEYVM